MQKYKFDAAKGDNNVNLDSYMLPDGSYRIILKMDGGFDSKTIMIVR